MDGPLAQPNPLPNQALVRTYVARWHASSPGRGATTLDLLFQTTMPENVDVGEVALKAAALNGLYAIRIGDVMTMARHIVALGIDARLATGTTDHHLVEDIARAGIRNKKGTEIRFYSFATLTHEQPRFFHDLVANLVHNGQYSLDQLAVTAGLLPEEFRRPYIDDQRSVQTSALKKRRPPATQHGRVLTKRSRV